MTGLFTPSGGAIAFGTFAAEIARQATRASRAALTRGDSPRTGQPDWRNSYYVGQIKDRV